jgi:FkbM family methyltransferase
MFTFLRDRLFGPRKSFALDQLDLKLAERLQKKKGFFIEAGANNGINQSNTLYLERYLNWRGLLVEPVPALAEACRLNRPKCIVENCALVPFDYEADSIEMLYCNLMSVVKGGMKSEDEERQHVEKGAAVQRITPYELTVPARSLSSLLDQHRIQEIDLLSLDVEGFELGVLKGIDFSRHAPAFMLIEARYREEIEAFLLPGYEVFAELSFRDILYRRIGKPGSGIFAAKPSV